MLNILLEEIGELIGATQVIKNQSVSITELIQLDAQNDRDDVVMWASTKNYETLKAVKKGTIICSTIAEEDIQKGCNYLIVNAPRNAFRLLLETYFMPKLEYGIASSAKVHPSVQIGKNVFIGENTVIEAGCILGDNVRIAHNTVLHTRTKASNNVSIGSNCVIGGVGFGYEKDEKGAYVVIPHIGNVVLEENVEIGNNTCIDRAVMGSTLLKKNVKVDNLVHIAHGVVIDENSLIIANALIGGSTTIGKNVWVAPSSTIINKVNIADDVVIGMGAVVIKSAEKGAVLVGNPAKPLVKN